ncbi:MAG: PQQ-dependent sugar dehydrogenase, partial [Candidatus Methylomirabilales bacterium]
MRRPLRASYLAASAALVAVLATVPVGPEAAAIGLPDSFAASEVVRGLDRPTLMSFAPDGRLFVSEQDGRLRVVRDGVLLPEPFLSVTVDSRGEHGLLGVALDPSVAANGYVYVFYTAPSPAPHHRISRFTADGDRAAPGSELVLFELDDLGSEIHHAGGSLAFGPDGKLYASVGVPNKVASDSQKLTNQRGKLLRINPDGTIPTDNPFYETATGKNRAIWVYGLRNPFTFAIQPTSGRMLINDVGQDEWEEINEGAAGSNYGWPETEGPTSDPRFRGPVFAYPHSGPVSGCSIVGAAFYNPPVQQFPPSYSGDYFFADYCGGWIRKLDPEDGDAVTGFATGLE